MVVGFFIFNYIFVCKSRGWNTGRPEAVC